MTPDFDELVGADLPEEERARLEHAHELLLAAGPLPELPPYLERPVAPPPEEVVPFFNRRRSAVLAIAAAAVVAAAFGAGYLAGDRGGGGFSAVRTIRLHGTGLAPDALASVQIGSTDEKGNWPMRVRVSNLRPLWDVPSTRRRDDDGRVHRGVPVAALRRLGRHALARATPARGDCDDDLENKGGAPARRSTVSFAFSRRERVAPRD